MKRVQELEHIMLNLTKIIGLVQYPQQLRSLGTWIIDIHSCWNEYDKLKQKEQKNTKLNKEDK